MSNVYFVNITFFKSMLLYAEAIRI